MMFYEAKGKPESDCKRCGKRYLDHFVYARYKTGDAVLTEPQHAVTCYPVALTLRELKEQNPKALIWNAETS